MAAKDNAFSSWYSATDEKEGTDSANNIFQDALAAFSSELSKDKKKFDWIIESGHTNVEAVLASVVEARVAYETRKGDSKIREALVAFSERVHHYSGIMDVLVSHHPEYTALAYGAIKFLFVGVMNYQKLLTQLCTGLSDIANILPRAALIMQLYSTVHIRKIIVAIYANILKFLLRALSWYQESKAMHIIHAITRPAELRYNDLLETIASLSQAMTESAWASSHAEQRDIHTDITTLVHWKPRLETKVDELMAHILDVKNCVLAEQAINASARLDVSQKLSEIQLAQVLQRISILNLPEPIKAFQTSLSMSKRHQAKALNRGPLFWLDMKTRFHLQHFCARSIESLRELKLPAIELNENIHTDAALAPRLGAHLRAQTEEDWVRVLASALQGIPLIYIVLDIEVLSQFLEPSVKNFWPNAFYGLFTELLTRSIKTIVRFALVSYGSSLLKGPSNDENRSHIVTVGGTNKVRGPNTARLATRNRATSSATARGSLNLETLGDGRQARGRVSRKSSRLQQVR
ncbi:hypothetical protein GGR58DRAFT_514881 [Xylaria digitata]|nr:hypothetical protein GGR58DRAFT_514881 [Xylaria digitata]